MKDIQKRKNKVIDLRKKKITVKIPIRVEPEAIAQKPVEPAPFKGGTFACIDCKSLSAQEFGRCQECYVKHQQIVAQLDARPRMPEPPRVTPNLTYRKEVSGGVVVTVSTSEPLRMG